MWKIFFPVNSFLLRYGFTFPFPAHPPLLLTLIRRWFLSGQESSFSSHVPDSITIWTEDTFLVSAMPAWFMWPGQCWLCKQVASGSARCLKFINQTYRSFTSPLPVRCEQSPKQQKAGLQGRLVHFKITWGTSEKGKGEDPGVSTFSSSWESRLRWRTTAGRSSWSRLKRKCEFPFLPIGELL